jgi:hypothetical protein
MRAFILLVIAVSSLSAVAAETTTGQDSQSAVSPWQGKWAGSEHSSVGQTYSLQVDIKVTGNIISGKWKVQGGGLKPITGRVKETGDKASITILQGGTTVEATLVDKDTLKYQGLRGYGTLNRE